MSRSKLPTEWQKRPIEKWNAATFRNYLSDKHKELFGIDYIARNYAMEAKLIRTMIDAHGPELTRKFIDDCFADYRPTQNYPGVNFAFMYTYMRERILPRVLADSKRKVDEEKADNTPTTEEIIGWL